MAIRLQGEMWIRFTNQHPHARIIYVYKSTNNNICLSFYCCKRSYKHWCSNREADLLSASVKLIPCKDHFGAPALKPTKYIYLDDLFNYNINC